ncbi:chemotaxis response regulator protein-glutamate methylesterase [Nocardioides sp. GY 10127]|uniref:protein-glutamate methylesterase/protein-glutamine glutaminase n=1 Tax=Nocardioides sp. GY 10127 TaxID=2569762 RepID=UPI0010A8473E|nr:chemotaxis response regulator protein-glutamate methylesterase [Nocardioides sp. GY 10127]TIC79017.1 chemotaxis response regulator protein-glutamate methylesterase [Nocardioides sp. GY 10127]
MSKIRVLVVDDSVVIRRLVTDVLAADERIEVVGTAVNGVAALTKMEQLKPDLVTMDIEMPEMDGIATLGEMRKRGIRLPVVMFSTLTERGAQATLQALELGASDYVTKPANVGSVQASMAAVREELIPKVVALVGRRRSTPAVPRPGIFGPAGTSREDAARSRATQPGSGSPLHGTHSAHPALPGQAASAHAGEHALLGRTPAAPVVRAGAAAGRSRIDVLAIGVSTGGPEALTRVLEGLPADLPVPVVVVQHMPPVFTKAFADRLDQKVPLHVRESAGGERVAPGTVDLAPGDYHLRLRRNGDVVTTVLDQAAPENYCRPAVDVLFRSVTETWGAEHVLAVVLTGMGSDGALGTVGIHAGGGSVLVQDEATCVVWGMPGAVLSAGVPADVLPLPAIAPAIVDRVRQHRPLLPSRTSSTPSSSLTAPSGHAGSPRTTLTSGVLS